VTQKGWREAILRAAADDAAGDATLLDLMARLLTEQDKAKNDLRRIGVGCTGMPWQKMIDEVGERLKVME
jgi:hypothetical protein